MKIELNEQRHWLRAESGGVIVLEVEDFPVADLVDQLRVWMRLADDISAPAFVFSSENPQWHAIFRIEPRSELWQFTSWRERVRSSELLSLKEWHQVLHRSGV